MKGYTEYMNKIMIAMGMTVGSTVGALLPQLWGDHDLLSLASMGLGFIGGVIGIVVGYKLAKMLE